MFNKKVLDAIGELNDDLVRNAKVDQKAHSRKWVKWGALAACLYLSVVVAIPVYNLTHPKERPIGDPSWEDSLQEAVMLHWNGCYYEVCNIPEALERLGLPRSITADMVGERVSYMELGGAVDYGPTSAETDIELFEYAPAPCQAVYVLRHGQNYMAAIFCNIIQPDSNASSELTELYSFYGINGPESITSITQAKWYGNETEGAPVTNEDSIKAFYEITTSLSGCGNDDFQAEVFDGIPTEEDQLQAHTAFADDLVKIRIETDAGLRFYLDLHPTYEWMYAGGTLSYYKMNNEMSQWVEDNILNK